MFITEVKRDDRYSTPPLPMWKRAELCEDSRCSRNYCSRKHPYFKLSRSNTKGVPLFVGIGVFFFFLFIVHAVYRLQLAVDAVHFTLDSFSTGMSCTKVYAAIALMVTYYFEA